MDEIADVPEPGDRTHADAGRPRPQAPRCRRFDGDGNPCPRRTTASDGWCRQCAGFTRPSTRNAPDVVGAMQGTRTHIEASGHLAVPVEVDEVADVRVSRRALDSFRYHHGGSDDEAESQIRMMLEDFVLRSARRVNGAGFTDLAREGFVLVLSPDGGTVTAYRTVHRERTWGQVRAGVRSRFSRTRQARGEAPDAGPPLPAADVPRSIDVDHVHLSGRARARFARLFDLRHASEDELDDRLRAELRAVRDGVASRDPERWGTVIVAAGLRWLVSDDARVIVSVGRQLHGAAAL